MPGNCTAPAWAVKADGAAPGVGRALQTAELDPPAVRRAVRLLRSPLEGFKVDFLWRIEGFVVEIDGFAAHAIADRFEADRLRDATLAAAGVRVMRVTWRQLVKQPSAVVVRLAQALARSARVRHEELTP